MTKGEGYTYSHFAKPADVWKHLALCEIMVNEQPSVYVETNSACASYILAHTPEQEYGIYSFVNKSRDYADLQRSKYYELESLALASNCYLGSPGLAMSILSPVVDKFYFFDLEKAALANVSEFAKQKSLAHKVEIINRDSIVGTMELLPKLPNTTLIHIDPYNIDTPSTNGKSYLDVFVEASERNLKCVLWYGFNTLHEKKYLNDLLSRKLSNKKIQNLACVELIMKIIEQNTIPSNPGILGNGILTSNLSEKSTSAIFQYTKSLTDLYKNSHYNGLKGDMYRDILSLG